MNYLLIRVHQKNKSAVNDELSLMAFAVKEGIEPVRVVFDDSLPKDELTARKAFLSFLEELKEGDKIVVSSLETLGWRVGELVQIVAKIFDKRAEIVCVDGAERFYARMEASKLLSKLSTTRAQNIQKGISKLGRPKGSHSKSKYDAYLPQIIEGLKKDRNISAPARKLGISRTSLKDYIVSRGL